MKQIIISTIWAAVLTSVTALAQPVQIETIPDSASIMVKGSSKVISAPAEVRVSEKAYVFLTGYSVAVLDGDKVGSSELINLTPIAECRYEDAQSMSLVELTRLSIRISGQVEIGRIGAEERAVVYNPSVEGSMKAAIPGWQKLVENELRQFLNFADATTTAEAAFRLAGDITEIWISSADGESHAAMTIKWSLYNRAERKVVYEMQTTGVGKGAEGQRQHYEHALKSASRQVSCDEAMKEFLVTE